MIKSLVVCEAQSHFNAVLILFFILGYLCIKYYYNWKKIEDTSTNFSNQQSAKARLCQDMLMKHHKEDQDFFSPSLE